MKKLSLKDVARFCGSSTALEGEISKISTDSRDIDENTLFVALIGERFDAHDFIDDVLNKGAKAVVCSKNVGDDERIIYVEDTGKALLDIAHGYRKLFNIPFIGLTGSVEGFLVLCGEKDIHKVTKGPTVGSRHLGQLGDVKVGDVIAIGIEQLIIICRSGLRG